MKHFLFGVTVTVLAAGFWLQAAPQQPAGWQTEGNLYLNRSLGFSFQFPAGWVVREVEVQQGTSLRATPPNSDHPVLTVLSGDLEDVEFRAQVTHPGQGYLAAVKTDREQEDFEVRGKVRQVTYADSPFYRIDFRSRERRNRTYLAVVATEFKSVLISFSALGTSEKEVEEVLTSLETVRFFDAELASWEVVSQAAVPEEVVRLGKDFLAQFPDSELAPYVHKRLALSYRQMNDHENLILQAEKALELRPDDLDVRPMLALVFAEQGENNRAIDYAQQGLEVLERSEKPADTPVSQWILSRDRGLADANYAQGLAYLKKALTMTGDKEFTLKRSVEYLEKATASDPEYDRAYFRLGDAYARLNDAEKAIQSFARAVAANGIASELAGQMLQKIYEALNRNAQDIGQLTQEQREYIDQKLAEREAHIQQLEAEEKQRLQQELERQEQLLRQQQEQRQQQQRQPSQRPY